MNDPFDKEAFRAFLAHCDVALNETPLYVLDSRNRVQRADWADWVAFKLEGPDPCRVDLTNVGGVEVSTVFLGIDMNHARVIDPSMPVLVFETMTFGPAGSTVEDRYSTWEEAEAGHREVVARLQGVELLKRDRS